MGVIVNFHQRHSSGLRFPGLIDYPVKITAANDVTIAFEGHQLILAGTSLGATSGSIDRVTGDVEADVATFDPAKAGWKEFVTVLHRYQKGSRYGVINASEKN